MSSTGSPKFGTLVHPSVHKSFYIELGEGSVITAGCVVTTQIRLGRHNIVNINSTLGHDCVFGDYCTVAPIVAVSGNVTLEDGVEVGTGASLRQGIRLGKGSMVGMGAVVTKDVEENGLVVGNPAKLMKILDPFL